MSYFQPRSVEAAVEILAGAPVTILAGGTDVYPILAGRNAWGARKREDVLDVSRLEECRGIEDQGEKIRLGGLTTWTDVLRADLPPQFECLKQVAAQVGGVQIQNRGTLAGNLCNASPAADGTPALLALDAAVELANARGRREVPLAEFLVAYRETACAQDELLTAVLVPKRSPAVRSCFLKLGARHYLVISIVMVAGVMEVDTEGRVAALALSIGACSPVAQRLPELEARLLGRAADAGLESQVQAADFRALQPIADCRASDRYRGDAAFTLTRRLLAELVQRGEEADRG